MKTTIYLPLFYSWSHLFSNPSAHKGKEKLNFSVTGNPIFLQFKPAFQETDEYFKVFSPSFFGLCKMVLILGNREGSIHVWCWMTAHAQLFFFHWGIYLDSFWVAKSDVIAIFYLLWWWSMMGMILVLFVCVVNMQW